MSRSAVATRSRASTTFSSRPDLISPTARATACCHSGAVSEPSPYTMRPGEAAGAISSMGASPTVVSHARPFLRPSSTRGTTSTEPCASGSKVNEPNATGPEPGTCTSSSMWASPNTVASHRLAHSKRPGPGGTATRAASPQATRPSPWWTQA